MHILTMQYLEEHSNDNEVHVEKGWDNVRISIHCLLPHDPEDTIVKISSFVDPASLPYALPVQRIRIARELQEGRLVHVR